MFAFPVTMLYPDPKMHIPDGFLSLAVSIAFWALSALTVGLALWRVQRTLDERRLPLMGVLGAAIFAGQMLNFAVVGGTSGHLLGAALAAILLGPWPAVLVMASVVGIQALVFQDGGLLTLGANVFDMGVVGVFVAYGVYRTVLKLAGDRRWAVLLGGFLSAWASVEVASLLVGLQLALSGTSAANVAVPAMGLIHALIGLGEGLITVGALAFLLAARRDLVAVPSAASGRGEGRAVWVAGLLLALGLAVLSPLASAHPDGLEWVAEQKGFLDQARPAPYGLIPDYVFPGLTDEALATILAGIVGTLIVFGVSLGVGYLRRRRAAEPGA